MVFQSVIGRGTATSGTTGAGTLISVFGDSGAALIGQETTTRQSKPNPNKTHFGFMALSSIGSSPPKPYAIY